MRPDLEEGRVVLTDEDEDYNDNSNNRTDYNDNGHDSSNNDTYPSAQHSQSSPFNASRGSVMDNYYQS